MSTPQNHPLPRPPPVPQHDGFYDDQHNHYYQSQSSDSQPLPPPHQEQSYSPETQGFPRLSSYPYQPPQQQPQHHRQQQGPLPPAHQSHHSGSSRGHQGLEDDRPRSRPRTFSLRSDKSHSNSVDLHETHAEKEARRLHSKADPTLAMNEAEPTVVAATVKSSLAPLRNMQHKDYQGNVIDDPDRSNPTRSRWERPLDTIRSFEAAIDGNYSNRQSVMMRSDSESVANWNRRNSYYGNNNYSSTPGSSRANRYQSRDSYFSLRPNQSEYGYGNEGDMSAPRGYNGYNHGPQQRYSRMASEPQYSTPRHAEPVYPIQSHHRSYETVASGSGSGMSGEPNGYTTDPTSSDNSSIERMQSPPKRQAEALNDYGIGFSQSPSYATQSFTVGGVTPQNGSLTNNASISPSGRDVPPVVPQKPNTITRKPTQQSATTNAPERPAMGEKRKSWFSRRFSKNS
ncbi:hypothetical protein MGG_09928 [Pyricularia oryzae 70-15]|uniref:DUF2406 domain-containing protein n=1 Tax=Pyricularia oryzae (strain 70-15 / ATCC MYA-4617 / FGSC 8958) TaxID=242507 RepID=G4MRJ4_PYRO7|nr:uncharacterized protein MGG_09928 [Pyricularia oryzae 70-15]EHA57417.1 hypothetical protein MGG_09928 [Pyricularia oryzae 70-15]